MKKYLLIIFFALIGVFSVSSCSNDDDVAVDSSIVGTWEETNYVDGTWNWTFNSNGKGYTTVSNSKTSPDYSFSFTYSYDGKVLKVSGEEDGKPYTDTYAVTISSDGKTMTWIEDGIYTTVLKKK